MYIQPERAKLLFLWPREIVYKNVDGEVQEVRNLERRKAFGRKEQIWKEEIRRKEERKAERQASRKAGRKAAR